MEPEINSCTVLSNVNGFRYGCRWLVMAMIFLVFVASASGQRLSCGDQPPNQIRYYTLPEASEVFPSTLASGPIHGTFFLNDTGLSSTRFLYAFNSHGNVFVPVELTRQMNGQWLKLEALHFRFNPFQEFLVYPISLRPGECVEIQWQASLPNATTKIRMISDPLLLPKYHRELQNEINGNYLELALCSMVFMMWLYVTLKYFQLRTLEYCFYSLYIFFTFLHFLVVLYAKSSVEWYSDPLVRIFYHRFFQTLSHVAYFQFFRYFTQTHKEQPAFDKVLNAASFFGLSYIAIDSVLVFLVHAESYNYDFTWTLVRVGFLAFVVTSLIFWVSKSNSPIKSYLIAGTSFLVLGGILTLIFNSYSHLILNWAGPFSFSLFYFRAGVLLEIICFTLGLGFKHRLDEQLRQAAEATLQREHLELEKAKEMEMVKSQFFTRLSHEFRTPLTLIQAPAEKIRAEALGKFDAEISLIKRNTETLLHLVNQVLDLSKIEANRFYLHVSPSHIGDLVNRVKEQFAYVAQQKHQKWEVHAVVSRDMLFFDAIVLEKVLYNLVSNAMKYTPAYGNVQLFFEQQEEWLTITVSDNGPGIPFDQQEKIFEPFVRLHEDQDGTGIGLPLVKELVRLHKGSVHLRSESGKGSSFSVRIPVGASFYDSSEMELPTSMPAQNADRQEELPLTVRSEERAEKPTLLIVEDNKEMREFMASTLGKEYLILEASDGEEGIRIAMSALPDIVVTDWMMPGISGKELAEKLKEEEITDHIPIVILTARANSVSRMEGFESGADDYVSKPFEMAELRARLRNLVMQRKRLRAKFENQSFSPAEKKAVSLTDRFMQRINAIAEKHLSDSSFSVDQFAEEAALSRVQLHRKLRAITGQSTATFLRNYRLDRAADLLRQSAGSISEIAYQTGFESPSHFARVYRERFGHPPSETPKL